MMQYFKHVPFLTSLPFILVYSVLAFGGDPGTICQPETYHSKSGRAPVEYDEISVSELATRLRCQEDLFLLDVRTPEEHRAYNIGGTLIPLHDLMDNLAAIPRDKPIVVYCRSGRRSHQAQVLLQGAGFQDVKNLTGGMLAWQSMTCR